MSEDFSLDDRADTERPDAQDQPQAYLATTSDRKVGRSFKKELRPSTDDGADRASGSGSEGLETVVDELTDALEYQLLDPDGLLCDMFDQQKDKVEGRVDQFDSLGEELRRLFNLKAIVLRQGETVTLDLDPGQQARVTLPLTRVTMIVEVRTLRYVMMISDRLSQADVIEHAANGLAHEMEAIAIGKGIEVSFVELRQVVLRIACETIVAPRWQVGRISKIR
jgi:hypothetical protein